MRRASQDFSGGASSLRERLVRPVVMGLPRRRSAAAAAAAVLIVFFVLGYYSDFCGERLGGSVDLGPPVRISSRKLLEQASVYAGGADMTGKAAKTERMGEGGCSMDDIVVYQGQTAPMTTGIPTYTVEVHNLCSDSACGAMSEIHFSCEWFSSARMINPRVFRRLRHDDCLVNDGRALRAGASISFQYANSFMYPLSVSSAVCSP